MEIAGGEMVVPAGKRISDEDVAATMPDVIVLAWAAVGGKSDPQQTYDVAAWSVIPAVRDRRVYVVRDELLNTPGPPLMDGARELLRLFYPEPAAVSSKRRERT